MGLAEDKMERQLRRALAKHGKDIYKTYKEKDFETLGKLTEEVEKNLEAIFRKGGVKK